MKIDMHCHTSDHSDGKFTILEMARAAQEKGLDGLVITDHHYMLPTDERDRLQEHVPGVRIFRGMEVTVGYDDFNVIGGDRSFERLEAEDWHVLADYARDTGVLLQLNHPFFRVPEITVDLDYFTPDMVEVASMETLASDFERIQKIARERGMKMTGNSDAHHTISLGLFYVDTDDDIRDETELAEAVRAGKYTIGSHEPTYRQRVEEVEPAEEWARSVIAKDGDLEAYLAQGGFHPAFFHSVAKGGSHMPAGQAIGLRG